MKAKIAFVVGLLFCVVFSVNAQKINSEKAFGGFKYFQNGKRLKMKQVFNKVSNNPAARKLVKPAKTKINIGNALAGVGGFCIGYTLGTAAGGGEPNWILAVSGIALGIASYPIASSGYKQANQAVRIYNNGLDKATGAVFKPKIEIAASGNSIGLLVRF